MSVSIAMVALGQDAKVSAQRIQGEWAKSWPGAPAPGASEKKEGTLAFRVGEIDVIYGLMPAPIPWSDLAGPCKSSWLWPEATTALKAHKKHVIVTVSSNGDVVDRLKTLTQATAALVAACEASVGVYWCDAKLVISPKMFRDFAVTVLPNGLPLYIWIEFRVGRKDGRTAGYTTGLSALGHRELETLTSDEPPGELRERLFGLAAYLIENGPVIQDGDTIGEDADERIRVVYSQSSFGKSEPVMRLDYGEKTRKTSRRKAAKGKSSKRRETRSGMTLYGYLHLIATIAIALACATGLYALLGIWMSSIILRVVILILPTLIGGFLLLVISDRILQILFGLEAFADDE